MKVHEERLIIFKQNVLAEGRNGVIKCTGIAEWKDSNNIVSLHVITNETSPSLKIEVPAESWYGEALDAILERDTLIPQLLGIHPLLDKMISDKLKGGPRNE